jgi:hypothetical protein
MTVLVDDGRLPAVKVVVPLCFRSRDVVALLVTWDTVISITNSAGISLLPSLSNAVGV